MCQFKLPPTPSPIRGAGTRTAISGSSPIRGGTRVRAAVSAGSSPTSIRPQKPSPPFVFGLGAKTGNKAIPPPPSPVSSKSTTSRLPAIPEAKKLASSDDVWAYPKMAQKFTDNSRPSPAIPRLSPANIMPPRNYNANSSPSKAMSHERRSTLSPANIRPPHNFPHPRKSASDVKPPGQKMINVPQQDSSHPPAGSNHKSSDLQSNAMNLAQKRTRIHPTRSMPLTTSSHLPEAPNAEISAKHAKLPQRMSETSFPDKVMPPQINSSHLLEVSKPEKAATNHAIMTPPQRKSSSSAALIIPPQKPSHLTGLSTAVGPSPKRKLTSPVSALPSENSSHPPALPTNVKSYLKSTISSSSKVTSKQKKLSSSFFV